VRWQSILAFTSRCPEAIYFGRQFQHVKTNIRCLKPRLEEHHHPSTGKATAFSIEGVWNCGELGAPVEMPQPSFNFKLL